MKLFTILFFWCILEVTIGQDCNGNYDTLQDLKSRATNNPVGNGPNKTDISLVKKWYNVGSNYMPNNSLSLTHGICGTFYPIWMNGTVPGVSEGRAYRTACTMGIYRVCDRPTIIEVMNCGTKMLYQLSPTAISTRYCFNPINPPIFQPDVVTVQPGLTFSDETDVPGQLYKKPKLEFRCVFQESSIDVFYYTVSWKVNEVVLFTRNPVLFHMISTTYLYENELIAKGYKLDISIHCVVRSSVSINGPLSQPTLSASYWLGIKVVNPNIQILQGQTATIQLQPTFPIGCSSADTIPNPRPKCSMLISMFDPDDQYDCTGSSISVHDSQKCGVSIPAFYYDEWTANASYGPVIDMTITTKDTFEYSPIRNIFHLKLVTKGTGLNDIAQNCTLSDIMVTSILETAWQGKWCYSYVDPHMLTFDGIRYENQNLGTFIMYRHSSGKQEVQINTKQCNQYATCACAVAVRAGGDMFIMDLCERPRIITHISCQEGILDVRQESSIKYMIYMPLGTIVSVSINTWWDASTLNIAIYPSAKDVYETEGLCGVLDYDQNNDFTTPSNNVEWNNNLFSASWRIDHTQSYFVPTHQVPDLWDENAYLCVCPAALITSTIPGTASWSYLDPLCSPSVFLSCTKNVNLPGSAYTCNIRTKRSKYSMSRETERILNRRVRQRDTREHHNHLVKRSTSQIAFTDAYEQCALFFAANCTTSLFEGSMTKSNLNSKNNSITNCALDYTFIGNMSLANLHCELYRSEFEQEIRRNNTFREVRPDVVKAFRAKACIYNCNNHGDCVNGTCVCHVSYIDYDCSVSLSNFPVIDDIYSGGLCKRDGDECCRQVPIYGSRFVKGITKQKIERFQLFIDGIMVIQETVIKDLPILNLFEAEINVNCETRKRRSTNSDSSSAHFVTGTRVSLTNDGTNFGSPHMYYIYDSRCPGVSPNDTRGHIFYILNGTCFISDTCYIEGDQDPMDNCSRCHPSENPYSWTNECTKNSSVNISKANNKNSSSTILIVSLSVGAVLMVSVISVIVIIKCYCKKQKRISVKFESNVAITTPGQIKFDSSKLFCTQKNLRENLPNPEQDDSLYHEHLWKHRPGTPGAISMNFE